MDTITDIDLLQEAKAIGPAISQYVNEEENSGRLSKTVLNALKEAGLFRMYLPKSLGGFEADPVTVAKVVEEIASHNTAAGWSLMVANTTTWWGGCLPEKGIDEIYKPDVDTFIASAFHPPKQAVRVNGGFKINGKGPLFSNVHEGKWIFVTAMVMENGQVKMTDGHPEVIGAFVKPSDCEIIDTWHTIGMRATDSNDVLIKDAFVPEHLFFPLMPGLPLNRYYSAPLYRFPAIGISVASLIPPVALAVARNAINELKMLADKKTPLGSYVPIRDRGVVQAKLGKAEALVQSARAYLFSTLSICWNKVNAGSPVSLEEKAGLLLAAAHTNQSCAQAVDLVYSAAGSSGIYTRSKLAHYFTDSQVIRQHGFVNESRYETVAQIYFGLPPDLPVIAF